MNAAAGRVSSDWIPYGMMHSFSNFWNGKSKAGIAVNAESALSHSAAFACRRAISESIAVLPRNIFKGEDGGEREPQGKHPSRNCLRREANPLQTSYKFFENAVCHVISGGNAYAELQFDDKGNVVAMWPLPYSRVKPQPIEAKNGLDMIYLITLASGREIALPKDRILHIPGIGFDGFQGYPLIDFMLNAVGLGQALEDYSSQFFNQGAQIPGYVKVPDSFTEEQIQNMRKHYDIMNNGLENAHRWKFLYESANFTPAGHSPADSEMTGSRVLQIQEIARFHRIPLHKIQETSKSGGYDSIEQFNIEFVQDTLTPYLVNFEQEINRKFFEAEEDLYVKFNVNALLRGDAKSRSLFYRTMVFTGIMTANEARALEDLPPIAGGNSRMVPLNMSVDGQVPGESDKSNDGSQRIQD